MGMQSLRQMKRHKKSTSQMLSSGGINEYILSPQDFSGLVAVINLASQEKLLPATLKSLLTDRELVDIARRIAISKMILSGKTYQQIGEDAKTSKNTIALVKQSLRSNHAILANIIRHII